jgi:UDP-N-acetylglucosamine--N-acetylmuramyl-(pentapeptide) pyrophosphoryl-undecaprenol N-acetylglucosamine transferase
MNNINKILIATGGTGGHIFPAYSLAKYLQKNNFEVEIATDKRGLKYLKIQKNLNIQVISSTTIFNKNFFLTIYSFLLIIKSFFQSLVLLIKIKPKIVFGMGGYSSFPTCMASKILGIPFFTYENNLYLGKANKYLLPFTTKMFVAYKELEGVKQKYFSKIIEIGNIIREDILNFKIINSETEKQKLSLLILGGSQAAKSFAQILPIIFSQCQKEGIEIKVYQQCQKNQIDSLKQKYKEMKIESEIFNFTYDLKKYFSKVNLAITRAGSSMLAEFLNCNVPIISIPLPNSADNHQLKNAKYFEKKGYGYLIEEHQILEQLSPLIKLIYDDKSLLSQIKINQMKHSDKNVFNKIYKEVEKIIYA